jgi:hypothetical protein
MATSANCVQHHSAFIYDRGGSRLVDEVVDLSQVQWSRVRDNVSEAMIRIEGESCGANAAILNQARSHRHEMVIFRGTERVWEGPLHRISSHSTFAEFHAKDVLSYVNAQPLTQVYSNRTVDGVDHSDTVTGRIEKILQYELANGRTMTVPGGGSVVLPGWEELDPPINVLPHLDVRHFVNEARTAMETGAYEMSVGMHLQNLARSSGIDFTVIGRRIIIWDVSRHIGVLNTMTREDFSGDVIVTEYGADHTQAAYSIGQDGSYGQALNTDNLDFYGPWTSMYTVYNEEGTDAPSQSELDSQASRNLTGRSPAPIEVRVPDNSTIFLSEDIPINRLVPGVQVPLRATLNARSLAQQQKIDIVRVTETATNENVQITLTPATKPDSDVEEP